MAVSAFAVAVLVAWQVHYIPLIQVAPGQPPLTRQGALSHLLLAASLACLGAGRRRVAGIFAMAACLLTVVVGVEYFFDRDLGFDQLLGAGYIREDASPAGRISPVAAITYFVSSVALLTMATRRPSRYASAIAGIIGSIVMAVGGVLFLVYLMGHMPAFGWGHFRHISVQASAVLGFLGLGIFILALKEYRLTRTLPQWLPLAIGLGLAAGAVGIWQALIVHEKGQLPLLSHIILTGGIMSAALVAVAVYQAQKATLHSRELQEGKTAFERLFEASSDALVVINRGGWIVGANQRVQALFGYTGDELLGNSIDSLVPLTLRNLSWSNRESCFGLPRTRPMMGAGMELSGRRKDGSEFPVEVAPSPLQPGGETEVLVAVRDITERKQAQEALRQSEERFRNVFEKSPLGLTLVYPDYRIMTANESMRRMLGYTEEEINGLSPLDLTHPEDREESNRLAQQLFKGELRFYKIEKRYVKKSGEIMWASLTATGLHDREGRFICSLGMIEDITERKEAQEALRESEERFRGVFETSPLGLALFDLDYRLVKVNASLCRMSGYSEADLIGMTPFDFTHPDDIEKSKTLAQRLFRGEIPFYKIEKRYVNKSGAIVWTTMTSTILRDRGGKPLYGLGMIEDISERKQAQDALRQSEEQFRGVFEQGPLGVTLIGKDYRLAKVNPAFCRMMGYSEAELTDMNPVDLTHPDDRHLTVERVETLFKTEAPVENVEKRYVTKSGAIIWGSLNTSVIHDREGRLLYGMGMIEDITERKHAEEELRTLSQRLSQAVRFASMSVWEWDPRTNSFSWDDTAFEVAGIPKVIPLPYEQGMRIIHAGDLAKVEASLHRVVLNKTQESIEFRVMRPDGELRYAYAAGGPILDRNGNVIRVVGIAVDITERKHAEEEMRVLSERLKLATRSASMGVWELNLTSYSAIWDDTMFQIFGIPKRARVPREDWVALLHPDELAKADAFLDSIVRGRRQRTMEFRILRSDGSLRHLSVTGGLVRDEAGNATGVVGIAHDITERKKLEQDLEIAREQAITSARLSALGMMAGGIAHEINNPLSIIHAMASDLTEMVTEQGSAAPQIVARKSAIIRETAERIAKIVKSLRQISREGSSDLFHPTPVAKILAETLEICRAKFRANDVDLLLPEAIPELSVPCREVQIAQALLNLLQNAFDAVMEQDVERWVRIDVEPRDGSVAISVVDSGPGIPSGLRSRIGEPFFTTKPVGKGTGLGLSLSKTIAEDHGGSLEYSDDFGHTRFSLVLPRARKAEAA